MLLRDRDCGRSETVADNCARFHPRDVRFMAIPTMTPALWRLARVMKEARRYLKGA